VKQIATAAETASQNKHKCLELAERANNMALALPKLAERVNDMATARVLERRSGSSSPASVVAVFSPVITAAARLPN
jgi:hypothetical protein